MQGDAVDVDGRKSLVFFARNARFIRRGLNMKSGS
jgi:hypothetical protein